MKPYFAKYLTIEVKWKGSSQKYSKELHLCSRDVKVGDELINQDGSKEIVMTEGDKSLLFDGNNFKVIGLISPMALSYVKEGDEFAEDEVQSFDRHYCKDGNLKDDYSKKNYYQNYHIKGPCNHFH